MNTLLNQTTFSKQDIVNLLSTQGEAEQQLLDKALQVKLEHLDNCVHLRGLIEYSSACAKDCLYCGLRVSNALASRYTMSNEEVLNCARQAMKLNYGSIAIQSGERCDKNFTDNITLLIREIKKISDGRLGITLSCGEQSEEVYRQWFEAGAHRYLLRIESSNEELYYKIHPHDAKHDFHSRLLCIENLIKVGYQTGTGVMVGLPYQTVEDLAGDLLFFKKLDVAMVGMGPFVPHKDTPLWDLRHLIPSDEERLRMTLKMIAVLRLMMPEINMVSATANQTIDPRGRERAVLAGANVIMPNLSPTEYRKEYEIYPNKPFVNDTAKECADNLDLSMRSINHQVLYNDWGDSLAFRKKHQK